MFRFVKNAIAFFVITCLSGNTEGNTVPSSSQKKSDHYTSSFNEFNEARKNIATDYDRIYSLFDLVGDQQSSSTSSDSAGDTKKMSNGKAMFDEVDIASKSNETARGSKTPSNDRATSDSFTKTNSTVTGKTAKTTKTSTENKSNNELRLDEDALTFLENLKGPIYSISAIGKARVGKSFWLGQLARKLGYHGGELFKTSDTSDSCTRGAQFVAVDMAIVKEKMIAACMSEGARGKNESSESGSSGDSVDKSSKFESSSRTATAQSTHRTTQLQQLQLIEKTFPDNGTLLFFDIQGSDIGSSEEDSIKTDQISAFVGLISSIILFFMESHIELSKLQFFDRVTHSAKLLRDDSEFELNVKYVLRRPLKLNLGKYGSRFEEFMKILGKERFPSGKSGVMELPELKNIEDTSDEILTEHVGRIWDLILGKNDVVDNGVLGQKTNDIVETVTENSDDTIVPSEHSIDEKLEESSLSGDFIAAKKARKAAALKKASDESRKDTVNVQKKSSSSAKHTKSYRYLDSIIESFSTTDSTKESQSLQPLKLKDGTLIDGPGLRAMMTQTIRWLQNDDLSEFFLTVNSVRERVCKSQEFLLDRIEKIQTRRDLKRIAAGNFEKFKEWCHDPEYQKKAKRILRAAEDRVIMNEYWNFLLDLILNTGIVVLLGYLFWLLVKNWRFVSRGIVKVSKKIFNGLEYWMRCFLSCFLPVWLMNNRRTRGFVTGVLDVMQDLTMWMFGVGCEFFFGGGWRNNDNSEFSGSSVYHHGGTKSQYRRSDHYIDNYDEYLDAAYGKTSDRYSDTSSKFFFQFFSGDNGDRDPVSHGKTFNSGQQQQSNQNPSSTTSTITDSIINEFFDGIGVNNMHTNSRVPGGAAFGPNSSSTTATMCSLWGFFLKEFFTSYLNYLLYIAIGYIIWHAFPRLVAGIRYSLNTLLIDLPEFYRREGIEYFYKKILRREWRPKVLRKSYQKKFDLLDNEHRSYTQQCIDQLRNSDEYQLKVHELGICKDIPRSYDWDDHYTAYEKDKKLGFNVPIERKYRGRGSRNIGQITNYLGNLEKYRSSAEDCVDAGEFDQ